MMDQEKVKEGIRLLLEGIGEDISREGLRETPDRIARMYRELFCGMEEDGAMHLKTLFHVDNSELVVEKDITFYSVCEHHMLPFYGKVHIAYIPCAETGNAGPRCWGHGMRRAERKFCCLWDIHSQQEERGSEGHRSLVYP